MLKSRLLKIRFPWDRKKSPARFNIPVESETSSEFTSRVVALLADPSTRIYIDTSFLMWLTRIGKDSRKQFFRWIEVTCSGRVCVPVWSAHEYLRHHISRTIVDELDNRLKEMTDVASKSYSYLRPFLDDPLSGKTTSDSQQAAARNTLNELQQLSKATKQWQSHYEVHAREVIEFINDHVPSRTDVFAMLDGIETLGSDRFDSRIPPGFQDRKKRSKNIAGEHSENEEDMFAGSNKCGDLVFWKEILNLAAADRARNMILLTNDQKNDWQLGGRVSPVDDELFGLKKKWRPLPFAHPMLSLEAKVEAQIQHVTMLDPIYLGVLLKRHGGDETKKFVDVAVVPDPPTIPTDQDQRKEKKRTYKEQAATKSNGIAEPSKFLFLDGQNLLDSFPALRRAWIISKKSLVAGTPVQILLANMQEAFDNRQSIADLITNVSVGTFNNDMLVSLGRHLHDQCIAGAFGNPEALADLLNILHTLPPKTASSIYLGLLGSMYFNCEKNEPRLPPTSPVYELIFDKQKLPFASVPIKVIRDIFKKTEKVPLYLPNEDVPQINIVLDHEPESDGVLNLGSITIEGVEVFSIAQKDPNLNLRTIFDQQEERPAMDILQVTCNIFKIPFKQVCYTGDSETVYQILPTAGFRQPKSIYTEYKEVHL